MNRNLKNLMILGLIICPVQRLGAESQENFDLDTALEQELNREEKYAETRVYNLKNNSETKEKENENGNYEGLKIMGLGVGTAFLHSLAHHQINASLYPEMYTGPAFLYENETIPSARFAAFKLSFLFPGIWNADTPTSSIVCGILFSWLSRYGNSPKLKAKDLVKPIGVMLSAITACSLTAGLASGIIYSIAKDVIKKTPDSFNPEQASSVRVISNTPTHDVVAGTAALTAQLIAPYAVLGLCAWILKKRDSLAQEQLIQKAPAF